MSSEDYGEERVMYSRSDNIELVINDNEDEIKEELIQSLFQDIKLGRKHQRKAVILYFIVSKCCNTNVIE